MINLSHKYISRATELDGVYSSIHWLQGLYRSLFHMELNYDAEANDVHRIVAQ